MRKITLTRLQKEVIGLLMMLTIGVLSGTYYTDHLQNEHPGMIRLHIIANSDSPEDQMLKLKVRNELIAFMEGQESLEDARGYIDDHLDDIETRADEIIQESGFVYTASAERKVTFIPEKSYEDLTLPAGNYEALKVTLGQGQGQNWWCVIFPQLCLIGEDAGGEKLILKSKIKEILKADTVKEKEN